ncbi:hypothetical protein ACIQWO_26745, partial [Pandoraea sp. NPDC090278]
MGISRDGKVIVGSARKADATWQGFRWTEAAKMQSVEAWLQANGVTVQGVQTETATGANADGSVVVGRLANGNPYIARVVAKAVPSPWVPLSPSTPAPKPTPSSSTSLSGLIDV